MSWREMNTFMWCASSFSTFAFIFAFSASSISATFAMLSTRTRVLWIYIIRHSIHHLDLVLVHRRVRQQDLRVLPHARLPDAEGLLQNEAVRQEAMPVLRKLNGDPQVQFLTFRPYFHAESFPFIRERDEDFFGCGRISRQDADKFAANTLHIYGAFESPVEKRGLFLGFDKRSEAKIGRPFDWIRIARNQREVSQQDFYRHSRIILQPTDTTENWPRIGFEAMASGSVLIVDNRGGWRQMVEHGKTGWLCSNERDFIYYASKMACEPNLRDDMAEAARARGLELGGLDVSLESWKEVLEAMARLPE